MGTGYWGQGLTGRWTQRKAQAVWEERRSNRFLLKILGLLTFFKFKKGCMGGEGGRKILQKTQTYSVSSIICECIWIAKR